MFVCVCVCFEFGIFGPVSNRSLDRLVQFPCRSELGGLCSNSWDISLMAWMFYCLATSIYASKMKYLWNFRFFFSRKLVILSDLEADYLNPYESSSRINFLIVPEIVVHGLLCALFLLTWHWFLFLITLPLTCYAAML